MLDKIFRRKALKSKAQTFANLYANPDFIFWKTEIVDNRLKNLQDQVLNTEPDTEAHKKFVIRYQELKFISDKIFSMWASQKKRLDKEDKKEIS